MSGSGFVKLYGSILDSSVWAESLATRIVWITVLAMADADGRVSASVGGLARRAAVSREEADEALRVLTSPDPDDRSGVDEGRRLRVVQGGWKVVNHRAYRDLRSPKQIADADRQRRHRERPGGSVTERDTSQSHTPSRAVAPEEEEEEEEERDPDRERARGARTPADAGSTSTAPPSKSQRAPKQKAPKAKRWTRVPEDWQANDQHRALAEKLRVSIEAEEPKFRDYEFAKPKTDADAAFRTWLRNAQTFGAGRAPRPGTGPKQPNHDGGWKPIVEEA